MADRAPRRGFLWWLASRVLWAAGLLTLFSFGEHEWLYRTVISGEGRPPWMPVGIYRSELRRLLVYARWRDWVVDNRLLLATGAVVAAVVLALVFRQLLILSNRISTRFSGMGPREVSLSFPTRKVDLLEQVSARRRPAGHLFVGMAPRKRLLGWRWKPVYLSPEQRSTHRHVIGKTGSGKTMSVLWPSVLQDALDGKGVLFMSGKGSDEELRTMKAIAKLANRGKELRVFSLPAWNVPELFTHTYNMVYVRPRTATSRGGEPVAMAQRVFSVLSMGNNEFYKTHGEVMFTNLCRLLHGMVDERGNGIPFAVRDLSVCLKAIGNVDGWAQALKHCLDASVEREAAEEIKGQVRQLDREALKTLSGIVGALEKYQSPIVNAYAPDIIFEDVLQSNGLVYVQLPANLFRIQARALGKLILMDVQQEGSLRQVFRSERNQRPYSVIVDEFYNFADISIVDSLNKLRDANVHYTLAHQSLADLELVSKEFSMAVWDNTGTKDILHQDSPELCERIARSTGTHSVNEFTMRRKRGPLFTSLATGEASSKMVEAYRLHPNAIKNLARYGQGYLLYDTSLNPIAYGMLPPLAANYPLPRNEQRAAKGLRLYENFVANRLISDAQATTVHSFEDSHRKRNL